MALANPNPFSERLEERDPKLFVINEKDGKYNAYSRQCQSNARRQPVILTDAEKEKIDREHPGSYEHAIKYGSNSDKQYWYICPRYWSLIKNTSLTEEEVNSGKYGNVIPQSSKKVPKDASIFEFTDNRVHKGKNGEYIQHYPGFILKKDSHPDGLCLPCCFKSWNTPSQKKRREECEKSINIVASDNLEKKEEVIKEELDVKMDGEGYIKSIDKFPLEPSRWGFLPIIIQKFLKTNNKECQISISNTNLKQNHICILRQGVEINNKQSFFACIASAYKVILNSQKIYTIKFIKKKILDLLNIDIFVTLQNGSLIDIFYKDSLDIDIEKYNDSKIYKNNSFFKKIVNAFENFKEYLNSDTYIDYTYLWDLICRPNEVLFKNGLNLVILELTNDDITDNVKLICPTNFYSDTKFDINKKTLILIKNGVYFEPIYTLLDSGKEYKIQRLFDLSDEKLLSNLRETLTMISDSMNKNCIVKQSLPNIYNFSKNKSLMTIIKILNNNNIKIINQVLNYNSLVIALIIEFKGKQLYIPVFPSSLLIDDDLDYKYIDEIEWNNYEDTKKLLNEISEITNAEILSKPKLKVEEDGLLIGFLTETNQFIGINPPVQDTYDDIEKINESNYIVADKKILLNNNEDTIRNKKIKEIELENEIFNVFRNTIRILLGKDEYNKELDEIKNIIRQDKNIEKIVDILEKITNDYIEFIDLDESDLINYKDLSICINNVKDNCNDNKFCKFDNKCKLLIPKNNLINNSDNREIYFVKIADQLIRYTRISNFILDNKGFISFNKIDYKLSDTEIIILQSMLNQEYFENLNIINTNNYINNNSYYTVNPFKERLEQLKISFFNIKKNKKKLLLKEPTEKIEEIKLKPNKSKKLFITQKPETEKEEEKEETEKEEEKEETEKEEETQQQEAQQPETQQLETKKPKSKKLVLTQKPKSEKLDNCNKTKKILIGKWKSSFPSNTFDIEYKSDDYNCSFNTIIEIVNDYLDLDIDLLKLKNLLISEYKKYGKDLYLIYNILNNDGKSNISKKLLIGQIDIESVILSEFYYLSNLDIIIIGKYYNLPLVLISSSKLKENNTNKLIIDNKTDNYYYFIRIVTIETDKIIFYRTLNHNNSIRFDKDVLSNEFQNDLRLLEIFDLQKYINNYKTTEKKPVKLKIAKDTEKEEETQKIMIKKNKSI